MSSHQPRAAPPTSGSRVTGSQTPRVLGESGGGARGKREEPEWQLIFNVVSGYYGTHVVSPRLLWGDWEPVALRVTTAPYRATCWVLRAPS